MELRGPGDYDPIGRPFTADIAVYEQRVHHIIDYVVFWGDSLRMVQQPGYAEFMRVLNEAYKPVPCERGVSPTETQGILWIYRKRVLGYRMHSTKDHSFGSPAKIIAQNGW